MLENANTALVRRWFDEIWNRRRLKAIDELLAENAIAHDLGGPGSTICGRAAFREAAEELHRIFGEMHLTVEDIFGVDDRVAVRLTARLRHTGSVGGRAPSGVEFNSPVVCLIRLQDGRIVEGHNFWDVAGILRVANAPATQTTLL